MFYVYILKSKVSGKTYIGLTSDLRKRLKEHNSGKSNSTKPYLPFEPIHYEAYKSEQDAKNRESKIKSYGQTYRRPKERLGYSLK